MSSVNCHSAHEHNSFGYRKFLTFLCSGMAINFIIIKFSIMRISIQLLQWHLLPLAHIYEQFHEIGAYTGHEDAKQQYDVWDNWS